MKKFFSIKISIAVILILNAISLKSQNLDSSVFSLLNLDYRGLEEVKKLHETGKDTEACAALLSYYKNRTSIINPDLNLNRISISKEEQATT